MTSTPGFSYRPDVDALRAVAVLPVVLFHLNPALVPGGFLGVDVFFVISGYLITSLLHRELKRGGLDLLAFWRRRILRILPALIVVVAITWLAGSFLLYAPDRYMLSVNGAAALVSLGNITHWRTSGDYWSADAKESPFLHTWSLGVEEQFYILYPLVLLFAWRLLRGRISIALAIGLVGSLALYLYGIQRSPVATFFLLPTRAWELLAGGLLAVWTLDRGPGERAATAMSMGGLAMIITSYALLPWSGQVIGTIVAVAGASLVVGAGSSQAFNRVGLTARPVLWIGLVSYSLYLWHWPVIVLARAAMERYDIALHSVWLFVASLILATLSWRFIETPVRHSRHRWVPVSLLCVAVGGAAALYMARDSASQEDVSVFAPTQWHGEIYNVNANREWPAHIQRRMRGIDVPLSGGGADEGSRSTGVTMQHGDSGPVDIVVLGDSHGLMWAPVIDEISKDLGLNASFLTADGTPVFFDPANPSALGATTFYSQEELTAFNQHRLDLIQSQVPQLVIIGASWLQDSMRFAPALLDEFTRSGAQILLLEDPPWFEIGDRNAPQYMMYLGLKPDAAGQAWSDRLDMQRTDVASAAVHRLAETCQTRCKVVPVRDLFESKSPAPGLLVVNARQPLYIDDDHLSVAGARMAKERIAAHVSRVLSEGEESEPASGGGHD